MAISTYTELKSAIADWLNRDDLSAVVPTFISLAEASMERVIRARRMLKRSTAPMDTQYSAVPADFLEVRSIKITSVSPVSPLTFITIEEMDAMDALGSAGGMPKYFTIVGNQIRVTPSPDQIYTAELAYYSKLDKLSDSVTNNWILTSHPDAYLYGSLLQAAPYLKDDERVGIWTNLFVSAVEAMKSADERAATSGGALTIRTTSFGAR